MESLFLEYDFKRHMSVNIHTGLWRCFKTGEKGNFIGLYAMSEGITRQRAMRDLFIKTFNYQDLPEVEVEEEIVPNEVEETDLIPISPYTISEEGISVEVEDAWYYLYGRKLFDVDDEGVQFYYCHSGRFEGRVLIPYFDSNKEVFFFQARALGNVKPKYLNPRGSFKANDVFYPFDEEADHLVLCEGCVDARSMQLAGVNATAIGGNIISRVQAESLLGFKGRIILGFDEDEGGHKGILAFEKLRKTLRLPEFSVCFPPEKDWNQAWQFKHDLKAWLHDRAEKYTYEYAQLLKLSKI